MKNKKIKIKNILLQIRKKEEVKNKFIVISYK
jgi:hypothetical protein